MHFLQHSYKGLCTVLVIVLLFSCQNRINKVRQLEEKSYVPQTVETDVNLVYTDSGKVAATLKSPKLLDYANLDFPYREFPKGVSVAFYDKGKKNTVVADYAISYEETGLVDLRGHVKIVTGDSTVLTAQQLYWDQDRKWVFTDLDYTIKMSNGTVNSGKGFDANQNFTNFISRSNTGVHYIKDKKSHDKTL